MDFIQGKIKTYISYDPAILLTGINQRERKAHIHLDYIQMFIAALFVRQKVETS